MRLAYTIVSCVPASFPVIAEVAGRTVDATIRGLVVEAVSEDGSMGHTFKLSPDDMEAAAAEFAVGNTLTVTLDGKAPDSAAVEAAAPAAPIAAAPAESEAEAPAAEPAEAPIVLDPPEDV